MREGPGWLNELGSLDYLTNHTSLSLIRCGFAPGFVNYKKGCTRHTAASDKVYQLLAQGRWFSPGTPTSSTTKTGRHDLVEILLKVALNTKNQSIMYCKNDFSKKYCSKGSEIRCEVHFEQNVNNSMFIYQGFVNVISHSYT